MHASRAPMQSTNQASMRTRYDRPRRHKSVAVIYQCALSGPRARSPQAVADEEPASLFPVRYQRLRCSFRRFITNKTNGRVPLIPFKIIVQLVENSVRFEYRSSGAFVVIHLLCSHRPGVISCHQIQHFHLFPAT